MMSKDETQQLESEWLAAIAEAADLAALEAVRVAALGKKGAISVLLKTLGDMSVEERQAKGQIFNQLRDRISQAIVARKIELENLDMAARLAQEKRDVTLPLEPDPLMGGRLHPVSQVSEELIAIFADMGFDIAEGPDIESEFYNFTALNIPEAHPARQMHDTFYLKPNEAGERLLLRTHTSPVQIRTMEAGDKKPPFRFIAPGRTYRCDNDQTHTPMFHQIEGLMIDDTTHMGHLKWVLQNFLAAFFEVDELAIRLRPSYFPFTEPSMEVDLRCQRKDGRIIVGTGDDWLEVGGSGMVHPEVLRHVGLDGNKYRGFAFGMGIDRLAMLKYGMPDLRSFFDADLRWLKHYGFVPLNRPALASGLSNGEIIGQ